MSAGEGRVIAIDGSAGAIGADEARRDGLRHSAASFERTSAQSLEHVETLRDALRKVEGKPAASAA